MYPRDTIAAISTPIGESGIGIVRLSGDQAIEIAEPIFCSPKNKKLGEQKKNTLIYGFVIDPESNRKIDEVLVSVLKAPHSYTAEDTVEFNCHGGIVPLRKVLELVLRVGARLAEPGEFTKRAFLNGRIDLVQAEAVIDLIKARTEASLQIAMQQLEGGLSQNIKRIRDELLGIMVQLEAAVDFSDEDLDILPFAELRGKTEEALRGIEGLLEGAADGKIIREGLRTVIAGRPNVGKSSLLNVLLKEERAIVTPVPGTTRDVIEEAVNIRGVALRLRDTAGIRHPGDEVEQLGVELSRKSLRQADLVLYVVDGSEPLTPEDFMIMDEIKNKKTVVIINKIDLPLQVDEKEVGSKIKCERLVRISALHGEGIESLKEAILDLVFSGRAVCLDEAIVSKTRHIDALRKAKNNLIEAVSLLKEGQHEEVVATVLKDALGFLGEIIGETTSEDVLVKIFEEFCIGK